MDLDSLKYAELQKLAKELGLKANVKADKLLKAVKEHYAREKEREQSLNAVEDVPPTQENSAKDNVVEKASLAVAFVNTRRGKSAGAKRKLSDAAAPEPGLEVAPSSPEDPVTPAVSESAKRRRVSAKTEDNIENVVAKKPGHKAPKGGKIPRLQKKSLLRPVTPNFKKLHEAQFNKMESIDSYVQRKTKQLDTYKNAVKELKMLSDETKQQIKGKSDEKPRPTRTSLFSPALPSKTEERRRHTLLSASKPKAAPKKSVGKEVVPFQPTVLSTRRINVRFTEATKDNEHKRSLIKTPARMSPCVASSTPLKQGAKGSVVKTTSSASKTPGPFVFTGNTSITTTTPGTQKKNVFDLKASLARPLNYKPHTGKLTPFGETKENPAANKSMTVNSHQSNYKQPKLQTREDRRVKQTEDRKQKKNNLLGARRGLVMM